MVAGLIWPLMHRGRGRAFLSFSQNVGLVDRDCSLKKTFQMAKKRPQNMGENAEKNDESAFFNFFPPRKHTMYLTLYVISRDIFHLPSKMQFFSSAEGSPAKGNYGHQGFKGPQRPSYRVGFFWLASNLGFLASINF